MSHQEQAYVSVLQWSPGATVDDQVEAVVASCAIDPYDAEQKVRRGVPQVLMRADGPVADAMIDEFRRRGVMSFAPRRREMAAAGEPARIKRLIPLHDGGGYMCEMWRGEGTILRFDDVLCLIRAKLRASESSTRVETSRHAQLGGYMVGGLGGAMIASGLSSHEIRDSRIKTTDLLDLYLRGGKRLRLDADKLNFDVLGEQRGYADHVNMNLLAERLRLEMPRAMYDEGFRHFVCPMEFCTDRVRGVGDTTVRTRSDAGPFEFYSVWAYLMYAHLLGGGPV